MDATVITNASREKVNFVIIGNVRRNEFTESELDIRAIHKSNSQYDKGKPRYGIRNMMQEKICQPTHP